MKWFARLILLLTPLAPLVALAQDADSSAATSANANAVAPAAFDIDIRAPDEVRGMLTSFIELQRYRAVTDLDDAELSRLVSLADANVRNLLGTLGYFNPKILITRDAATGSNSPTNRPRIVIAVDPGEFTRIADVKIEFTGDIATSTDAGVSSQRDDIRNNWRLPAGRRFTQDSWDSAKNQALRQLIAKRYPAGKIDNSLADIDAETKQAHLGLKLDSGRVYKLGKLDVRGVDRYDPLIVPRLARLYEGDIYDQDKILEAQQRLASSGYFDSVFIYVDPNADPDAAPVQVQLREAPLKKVVFGLGYATDTGPRASVEHTIHRLPWLGWRAVTKLQIESKSPFAQTEWTAIPDPQGWRWNALGRIERLDDNTLVTNSAKLRFGQFQAGDKIDRNIYAQFDSSNVKSAVPGIAVADTGDGKAISANYVWSGRYYDALPFPTRGYGIGFEGGGGYTLSGSKQPFVRGVAKGLTIIPLSPTTGRIALRAEGAAVIGANNARVPSALLFRTGGDTTVRGYGYRDIGVPLAGGVIGPGRYMTNGSVEWQRPIFSGGLATDWETTLFVDAGSVADKPQDMSLKVGVGAGARWKSPIGPLQMDVAYGIQAKAVRLHLSVGFVF